MPRTDRLDILAASVAIALILLLAGGMLFPDTSLFGAAFFRPSRCGNNVCNLHEDPTTCPADCGCSAVNTGSKPWLGAAACCPGLASSNGICCPEGMIWDGQVCAARVAHAASSQRIDCTPDMRAAGNNGGWLTCPSVYAPVCTFDAKGAAQRTLPSDCQACVDPAVSYFVRGECPSI